MFLSLGSPLYTTATYSYVCVSSIKNGSESAHWALQLGAHKRWARRDRRNKTSAGVWRLDTVAMGPAAAATGQRHLPLNRRTHYCQTTAGLGGHGQSPLSGLISQRLTVHASSPTATVRLVLGVS